MSTPPISDKLGAYKKRLADAGLDDNAATTVLVDILADAITEIARLRRWIFVLLIGLVGLGVATAGSIFAVGRQSPSREFVDMVNKLDGVVQKSETASADAAKAAQLSEAESQAFLKSLQLIETSAASLDTDIRALQSLRNAPSAAPTVAPKQADKP